MIALLSGTIIEKGPESIIVDVAGVGYEVFIPAGVLLELGATGEPVELRTHLDVKEDALQLFGFLSKDQLEMFRMLISVGNVGPRSAMAVLSVMDVPAIVSAIHDDGVKAFTAVPGIGKKTAQRIILELTEKVTKRWGPAGQAVAGATRAAAKKGGLWELARDALLAQGFKGPEAEERLNWARSVLGDDASIQTLITEALRYKH